MATRDLTLQTLRDLTEIAKSDDPVDVRRARVRTLADDVAADLGMDVEGDWVPIPLSEDERQALARLRSMGQG